MAAGAQETWSGTTRFIVNLKAGGIRSPAIAGEARSGETQVLGSQPHPVPPALTTMGAGVFNQRWPVGRHTGPPVPEVQPCMLGCLPPLSTHGLKRTQTKQTEHGSYPPSKILILAGSPVLEAGASSSGFPRVSSSFSALAISFWPSGETSEGR